MSTQPEDHSHTWRERPWDPNLADIVSHLSEGWAVPTGHALYACECGAQRVVAMGYSSSLGPAEDRCADRAGPGAPWFHRGAEVPRKGQVIVPVRVPADMELEEARIRINRALESLGAGGDFEVVDGPYEPTVDAIGIGLTIERALERDENPIYEAGQTVGVLTARDNGIEFWGKVTEVSMIAGVWHYVVDPGDGRVPEAYAEVKLITRERLEMLRRVANRLGTMVEKAPAPEGDWTRPRRFVDGQLVGRAEPGERGIEYLGRVKSARNEGGPWFYALDPCEEILDTEIDVPESKLVDWSELPQHLKDKAEAEGWTTSPMVGGTRPNQAAGPGKPLDGRPTPAHDDQWEAGHAVWKDHGAGEFEIQMKGERLPMYTEVLIPESRQIVIACSDGTDMEFTPERLADILAILSRRAFAVPPQDLARVLRRSLYDLLWDENDMGIPEISPELAEVIDERAAEAISLQLDPDDTGEVDVRALHAYLQARAGSAQINLWDVAQGLLLAGYRPGEFTEMAETVEKAADARRNDAAEYKAMEARLEAVLAASAENVLIKDQLLAIVGPLANLAARFKQAGPEGRIDMDIEDDELAALDTWGSLQRQIDPTKE